MNEVVLTQEEFAALTKKAEIYKLYSNNILRALQDTASRFVEIGFYLTDFKDKKLYEIEDFKDIYEYASKVFGLSKTTTSNFMGIYTKFGMSVDLGSYKRFEIKEDYRGFNLSKLIELLPVKDEDLGEYKPSMTVQEIRSLKAQSKLDSTIKSRMDEVCPEFIKYFVRKLNAQIKLDGYGGLKPEYIHNLNAEGYKIYQKLKIHDLVIASEYPEIDDNTYIFNLKSDKWATNFRFTYQIYFICNEDLSISVSFGYKFSRDIENLDISIIDSYGVIDDEIAVLVQDVIDAFDDYYIEKSDKQEVTLNKPDYSEYNNVFMDLDDFSRYPCYESLLTEVKKCKELSLFDNCKNIKFSKNDVSKTYGQISVSIDGRFYGIDYEGNLAPKLEDDSWFTSCSRVINKYFDKLEDEDKEVVKKYLELSYDILKIGRLMDSFTSEE